MFHNYHLRPMLLEEVGKIFQSKDYLYEIKFDGNINECINLYIKKKAL